MNSTLPIEIQQRWNWYSTTSNGTQLVPALSPFHLYRPLFQPLPLSCVGNSGPGVAGRGSRLEPRATARFPQNTTADTLGDLRFPYFRSCGSQEALWACCGGIGGSLSPSISMELSTCLVVCVAVFRLVEAGRIAVMGRRRSLFC